MAANNIYTQGDILGYLPVIAICLIVNVVIVSLLQVCKNRILNIVLGVIVMLQLVVVFVPVCILMGYQFIDPHILLTYHP